MDVINWFKGGYPVKAQGMGGRQVRKGKDHGEIFDHHYVEFTYADGSILNSQCRHIPGTMSKVDELFIGTKGRIAAGNANIIDNKGKVLYQFDKTTENNPYQTEHDELFAAIAKGEYKFNDVENGAKSTMTSILGRMATYSGQVMEWDKAINGKNASDPIVIFRSILAKTWNDHRVAINLYNDQRQHGQDPTLVMVSYEGTDAVNHLFAPFHPPYREGISEERYRKFWPAVANYYAEVDRLIGEWMSVLPHDTTVMIMSSYGFRWGKNRPRTIPNGGAALSDHRNPGMFVAYGPLVAPNRAAHPMSVYDVAPTVLTLLGLPQSIEMPGHVATWAFKDIAPITSVRVVSYGEFVTDKPLATSAGIAEKAYAEELQAIGHLNDPSRNLTPVLEDQEPDAPQRAAAPLSPERWGQYAYFNNLGVEFRAKGKLSDAVDAFDRAIDINPTRPTPHLNEAMTCFDRQLFAAADEQFLKAVALGLPNAERYFVDFAALYRQRNMNGKAIGLLYQGRKLFPQSYLIAANLGSTLLAAERYSEGVPELVRALGLQPSSTLALNNLGLFYLKQNDYGRALDFWNRSLTIEPHQPEIREAAAAARSRL